MSPTIRSRSIDTAKATIRANPLFLDTETTGLGPTAEIVEISILNDAECVLFNSLIQPKNPIPPEVTEIHGITNEMVKDAPIFPMVWPEIREILRGRLVVIYNAPFDVRMMRQSLEAYQLPMNPPVFTFDMLKLYAEFYGAWDLKYKSYKLQSLKAAGLQCKIELPNSHRSAGDCLLTRALLHYLADFTP